MGHTFGVGVDGTTDAEEGGGECGVRVGWIDGSIGRSIGSVGVVGSLSPSLSHTTRVSQ